METVFIKGWNRTTISEGQYKWHCPYCDLSFVTHLDSVEHGCQLKEYGLGNLVSDGLKLIGVTKKKVTNLLRTVTRKKKIKCNCGFRLNIVNTIGRFLKINYLLTTWKRGISPRAFRHRRGLRPQKINAPACGPGCPPAAGFPPSPACPTHPGPQRTTGQARGLTGHVKLGNIRSSDKEP